MPVEAFVFYLVVQGIVGLFFLIASLGAYLRYENADKLQTVERQTTKRIPRMSKGVTDVLNMSGFEQVGAVEESIVLDKTGKSVVFVNPDDPTIFVNVFGADQVYLHSFLKSKKVLQTIYNARARKFPKQVAKRYQIEYIKEGVLDAVAYHSKALDKLIRKNQQPLPVADLEQYFDQIEWWQQQDFMPYLAWQTYLKLYGRLSLFLLLLGIAASIATSILLLALLTSDTVAIGTRETIFIASSAIFVLVISASTVGARTTIKNARAKLEGA